MSDDRGHFVLMNALECSEEWFFRCLSEQAEQEAEMVADGRIRRTWNK